MHLKLTLAFFSSILALALGMDMSNMGGMPAAPGAPNDEDMEKVLYPCFRDSICGKIDASAEQAMSACLDGLSSTDVDEIMKTMKRMKYTDIGSRVPSEMAKYFCPIEDDNKKKEVFSECVRDFVAYLTKYCSNNQKKGCDKTTEALMCVKREIDTHTANEECKPEE